MTPEQEIKLLKELLYCTKRSCNNCGKVNCENFQRQRIDCCGLWVSYKDYIKELEKENAELRNNGFTVSAMTEQQLKVALEKGERLEKENAELKTELEEYKNGNFVQTVNQIIEGKDKRLEQAKEIIKDLLRLPYANDGEVYGDVTSHLDKAEQFLKEIEKC